MAGAVRMPPVAVFVVVILGSAIAGVLGAIFAIPTAAAILAITDYLRQRDVLLRSEHDEAEGQPADATGEPDAVATPVDPADEPAVPGAGTAGA